MPGDVRNDLYLTLEKAEFERGGKSTAKNVLATVTVHDSTGQVIHVSMHLYNSLVIRRSRGSEYEVLGSFPRPCKVLFDVSIGHSSVAAWLLYLDLCSIDSFTLTYMYIST